MTDSKELSNFDKNISHLDQRLASFKSGQETLQYLEKVCEKYTKDPNYVFKSCVFNSNLYLIVLKKLPETKTNEYRKNVTNPMFAKFRADVLDVIEIINILNILDPHQISVNTITNTYCDSATAIYSVGQTVCPDKYDTDINNVCSSGIHYFKSIEPAFMFRVSNFIKNWNDIHIKTWYDNGILRHDKMYINGDLSGTIKLWYDNGKIQLEGEYSHDKETGLWTEWYENGVVKTKNNYVDGKESGLFQTWYKNGALWQEGNCINGYKSGIWKLWDGEGVLESETDYVEGKKISCNFVY